MNKRRAAISGALALVLVGIAAWAFGFFSGTDPAVAELQQLGSQMWDKNMPDAQRNQMRDEFRQRMDSMTEDQRRAFFNSSREQWSQRSQQRMDEYFKLPKAEQTKRLDEILDRMVKGRNSQQQNASATQANQNGGRGNANRGNRGSMTDAQREERSKKRLDRSTPKMRAQFTEFRKQLETRAQQRGINMGDPGRGGGWGFRGA
jgi:hypothetical protein